MASSLRTFQATTVTAAALPFALRQRGACFVVPPQRWRVRAMRAAQWQGRAREMDPQGSLAKRRWPLKLTGGTSLRMGAGVALALALGGVSWATARGGSAYPVLKPVLVCVLNNATDGASEESLEDFMDGLSKLLSSESRNSFGRRDPKDKTRMMRGLERQFSQKHNADQGLQLTEVWILQRDWEKAKGTCQQLTNLYPHDPRPHFLSVLINMNQAMETMLSTDPKITDDIEMVAKNINEMTNNAIDAWKEYIKYRKEQPKG